MSHTAIPIAFVQDRLRQIYDQPLVYGRTAEGLDLILHYYHELWAVMTGRLDEYRRVSRDAHADQLAGSGQFAAQYRWNEPVATDDEVADYVVEQWQRITESLGIPIHQPLWPSESLN